jgi:hypothetical protein
MLKIYHIAGGKSVNSSETRENNFLAFHKNHNLYPLFRLEFFSIFTDGKLRICSLFASMLTQSVFFRAVLLFRLQRQAAGLHLFLLLKTKPLKIVLKFYFSTEIFAF